MTWNYRRIKDRTGFTVREVYYDEEGNPQFTTKEPCSPWGKTEDELNKDLKYFMEAMMYPVLDMRVFREGRKNKGN